MTFSLDDGWGRVIQAEGTATAEALRSGQSKDDSSRSWGLRTVSECVCVCVLGGSACRSCRV